ncbi:MAG: hypothetical protein ACOH2T_03145 [Pseudomonas sp.]
MQTTQHNSRCPVYLHPAAASNLRSIEAVQRRTGLLVIITPKGRPTLAVPPAPAPMPADHFSPWGGDAA